MSLQSNVAEMHVNNHGPGKQEQKDMQSPVGLEGQGWLQLERIVKYLPISAQYGHR